MIEGWAILELMGHRRIAGIVSEATVAGGAFIRIDTPASEDTAGATQFYSPAAIYAITPTTEEIARAVALNCAVQPVQRWELKALPEVARDEAEDRELFDSPFEEEAP
jgi:hypothetical protein